MDGRRAYRCTCCGNIWTEGLQGRQRKYSEQRPGYQFKDTGAASPNGGADLPPTGARQPRSGTEGGNHGWLRRLVRQSD